MRRNYKWTSPELRRLKECYAGMSDKGLAIAFSPHTINSIRTTAKKYGLRRPPRGRDWKKMASKYTPIIFSVPHRVNINAAQGSAE